MPYPSVSDIPEPVKDALPPKGQKMWMEVFNSTYESLKKRGITGKEADERAASAAWSVISEHYKKGPDGKWREK